LPSLREVLSSFLVDDIVLFFFFHFFNSFNNYVILGS
jgi:hypothetical protein